MSLNLDELKKDHKTSYLAGVLERLEREENDVREMMKDESLKDMAQTELDTLLEQKNATEKQIQDILDKEKEEEEFPNEIVLEVRAGAGGDEAALFAWELAHMYERFAEIENWNWKTNYESKNDLGGFKEASFEIKGKEVYKKSELEDAVREMLETSGPFLLDVHIEYQEHVLPMIPPGKSYKDTIIE